MDYKFIKQCISEIAGLRKRTPGQVKLDRRYRKQFKRRFGIPYKQWCMEETDISQADVTEWELSIDWDDYMKFLYNHITEARFRHGRWYYTYTPESKELRKQFDMLIDESELYGTDRDENGHKLFSVASYIENGVKKPLWARLKVG